MNENFKLYKGIEIPKIGFGTWLINGKDAENAVYEAIRAGYRLIDTAQAYENEKEVGLAIHRAINENIVKRGDLFVTSKVAAEHKSYQEAYDSILETLEKLNLDYVDLMLIHSPEPWKDWRSGDHFFEGNIESWKAMQDLYKDGKIRAIGVSNFEKVDLENIINNCEIKPMVNQLLAHISNTPFELIDYCKENNILVEAYSPIAHGEVLNNSVIKEMAEKYNVSVAQICLKYILQLGMIPLPKASKIEHIKSNLELDFEISNEDMEVLKDIKEIENYGDSSYFPVFSKKED